MKKITLELVFLSNDSVQFSSVTQSCLTLCDPMNCSTPGLPVHYQLPESTQTHVHCVGDAISSSVVPFSSHLQSFPASGSFQMSQLFTSEHGALGQRKKLFYLYSLFDLALRRERMCYLLKPHRTHFLSELSGTNAGCF